jgi:hypothetical protein
MLTSPRLTPAADKHGGSGATADGKSRAVRWHTLPGRKTRADRTLVLNSTRQGRLASLGTNDTNAE